MTEHGTAIDQTGLSVNGGAGLARPPFDQKRAEAAVRELLLACGEDPEREGLRDTPARVARARSARSLRPVLARTIGASTFSSALKLPSRL